MDNQFEKNLLKKIKSENIQPTSKWHFLLKDYIVWTIGAISLLVGAAAVSVMIYIYQGDRLELYFREGGIKEFVLLSLPYFWILLLSLFTFLVYYYIKHTKNGYRYPAYAIIFLSISASVLLGGFFFELGLSKAIDDVLGENAPYYETLINPRMLLWCSPEDGRLMGVLIENRPEEKMLLLDIRKKQWLVDVSGIKNPHMIPGMNEPARFMGEMTTDNSFRATEVHPVHSGRGFIRRHMGACPEADNCPMRGMMK